MAFEPNKFLQPRHLLKNLKYFNKCLWTENCINDFVIMRNEEDKTLTDMASSLKISGKNSCLNGLSKLKNDLVIKVECISFVDLLKSFNKEDEIYIKLDIEGSEFPILYQLLENIEIIKNIKEMWIEFHVTEDNGIFYGDYRKSNKTKYTSKNVEYLISKLNQHFKVNNWH